MSNVIPLKNKNVDEAYVAFLEAELARARRGESRGGLGVIDMGGGTVRICSIGSFADDDERAVKIASEALDVFCSEAGIPHPKVAAHCVLPPGLRKA